jgi:hypothetical protein
MRHHPDRALDLDREGDGYVQTLKGPGASVAGLFDRPEWEWTVPGPDPDLGRLDGTHPQGVARPAQGVVLGVEIDRSQPARRPVPVAERRMRLIPSPVRALPRVHPAP